MLDSNGEGALNNQIQKIGASKNIFTSADLTKLDFLNSLEDLKIDLIILAWWPYIITIRFF